MNQSQIHSDRIVESTKLSSRKTPSLSVVGIQRFYPCALHAIQSQITHVNYTDVVITPVILIMDHDGCISKPWKHCYSLAALVIEALPG